MSAEWRIKYRIGPQVEHAHAESLEQAIDDVRARVLELRPHVRKPDVDVKIRTFEASTLVAVRVELKGPKRARGGIDVMGDGSLGAYVGWIRKRELEPVHNEDVYELLKQALAENGK